MKIFVNATGAQGGNTQGYSNLGGFGGWVQAFLSVTAGQTLYIYVGGDGITGERFNGGGTADDFYGRITGGGGGATDIRTMSGNLTSRLIVAGGGGSTFLFVNGGNGGIKRKLRFCFLF